MTITSLKKKAKNPKNLRDRAEAEAKVKVKAKLHKQQKKPMMKL